MIHHPVTGEPLLSIEETAVLLGVSADQLLDVITSQHAGDGTRTVRIPTGWMELGRSRADIYKQATGDDDMIGAVKFWRRHGQT